MADEQTKATAKPLRRAGPRPARRLYVKVSNNNKISR